MKNIISVVCVCVLRVYNMQAQAWCDADRTRSLFDNGQARVRRTIHNSAGRR